MAGILKPDGGELCYFGKKAAYKSSTFRRFCGYVPQENPLMEELTVQDNLKLWGGSHNANTKELVAQFQLEDLLQTEVSKLSGGMKRRLSIASALVENPPFLLMDEPTTALDLYYKESIHQWMKTYQQKNGFILMTTHDESEIRNADSVQVEVPTFSDRLFTYDYRNEKSGYLLEMVDQDTLDAVEAKDFTIDGTERSCKGYQTVVTKDNVNPRTAWSLPLMISEVPLKM